MAPMYTRPTTEIPLRPADVPGNRWWLNARGANVIAPAIDMAVVIALAGTASAIDSHSSVTAA